MLDDVFGGGVHDMERVGVMDSGVGQDSVSSTHAHYAIGQYDCTRTWNVWVGLGFGLWR